MSKIFYLPSRVTKLLLTLSIFCFAAISSISAQYYQGSRYYYNLLGSKNYGVQSQALYNYLVAQADALHTDFTTTYASDIYLTVSVDGFGFPQSGWNGQNVYYELDVINAIDDAFVAFFQDNVQYFMIETNVGLTENREYTVHFEAPSTNQTSHLYDYRLPADRRAHMDMVNATFAKYAQLTQNAASRYEKARLIHDKIVSDWDYATDVFSPGAHDLMGPIGYAPDGIVCEAYAKMFAFMATNLGVPALFVPGDMLASDGFPAGGHAWNLAEMDDGKYYFLDLTWVDSQRTNLDVGNFRNPLNYNWFLRGHDNGIFESKHYAGIGSFVTVYENPANLGGPDYDYKNIYSSYKFLGDIQADRSLEFDLGTYYMPANGILDIQPNYYDKSLVYGVDYELEFEQPLKLGKNRVWFHGKGNYRGLDFGVVKLVNTNQTLNIKVTLSAEMYEYTGQAVEPKPMVKNGSVTLIEGLDYLVSYQNNINRGTAKVIVTGLGLYAGRYEKEFQIIVKSNGTNISAADFQALFPSVANVLVVIKKPAGSKGLQQQQQNVLTRIQNAANYYGIDVYYIDWSADITNYSFYNTIMGSFAGMGVSSVSLYPVLAAVRNASSFCVDAFEKQVTAGGGGYMYGLQTEPDIREMIVNCIDINTPTPMPMPMLAVNAPVFANQVYSYARPAAQAISINNTGLGKAAITTVNIAPATAFEIGGKGSAVAPGSCITTWTVRPKTGLDAGTYAATLTVTYDNNATATAQVNFTVNPAKVSIAGIDGITPPIVGATPVTAITANSQYSGTVTWNPSHTVFQNNTAYTATITLTAAANYTFKGVAANFFAVAGASAAGNASDNGTVTVTFPASILTAINPVEQTPLLQAYVRNGKLYVSGLPAGKVWTVYNIMGKLIHQATVVRSEENITLPSQGIYIINCGNRTVKVMY